MTGKKIRIRWDKVLTAAMTLAVIGVVVVKALAPEPEMMTYRYTVQAGDTVWDVCSRVKTDADDIRQLVWQTMKDSHIEHGDELRPGQVLVIRVKEIRNDT